MPFTRVSWDQEMDLEGPDLVKYIWKSDVSDPYTGYGDDVDSETPDFTPEPVTTTFYAVEAALQSAHDATPELQSLEALKEALRTGHVWKF